MILLAYVTIFGIRLCTLAVVCEVRWFFWAFLTYTVGRVSLLQHRKPRPQNARMLNSRAVSYIVGQALHDGKLEYSISNEAREDAQLWSTIQLKQGSRAFSQTSSRSSFKTSRRHKIIASQL
uniref:Putative secreted protein n=1 Tax=Amblyomma cajennense TaxID=34607 RepID=A0A023FCJ3_AMBCJ